MAEQLPDRLRAIVERDVVPVRPLPPPIVRAQAVVPIALALATAVLGIWGLRGDHAAVGPWGLWAASAFQVALAVVLARAAIAESMPGRLLASRTLFALSALALVLVVAVTAATFTRSRTFVPPLLEARYFWICFTRPVILGLPAVAALILMLRRGLLSRPALVGALAGLAAGLVTDAGWRLYCHVSDPGHVLAAHLSAVMALAAAGAFAGQLTGRGVSAS